MKKLAAFVLFLAFAFAQPTRAQTIPATASLTTQGTAAACTATSTACLYVLLGPGTGATGIELSGTWTGTVSFYGAITASGVTKALASTDASPITSATANGAWQFNTAAFTRVLVVFTTASTGTVKVSVTNSNASARATGGSGGGGGSPTGSEGDVQLKNGSLFGHGSLNDNGAGLVKNSGDTELCGPNMYTDIRCYGAAPGAIHTTATGSGTSLTVGSSSFANTNQVTVAGGGANCGLGTVGAPTVVPGEAEGETVPDAYMTAGVTGSSTYNYLILAEDAGGCVSAAGTATTITTGTAALGKTSVTLSAISLTGTTLSFTSSAAHGLAQYAQGHITSGANSFYLSGWFTINTITDSTHAGAVNTVENAATTQSAASGSLVYFIGNNIHWSAPTGTPYRYYVCAERPGDGAYHIIGQALPGKTQFVDFGWNLTQTIPWWISDANCNAVSSQPQLAKATISSGGGTTGLTISPGLTNAVSGNAARLDNSLAIQNALGAAIAKSAIYIPMGTAFEVNSPTNISGDSAIIQPGGLTLNAPFIWTGGGGSWTGEGYKGYAGGSPQFAAGAGPEIICNANPCLDWWTHDAIGWDVSHLTVGGNDNGVLSVWASDFTNHFHEMQWITGNDNNDNMGIALYLPDGVPQTNSCENCFIGAGTAQNIDQTWAPLIYLEGSATGGASGIILRNGIANRRGIYAQMHGGLGDIIKMDGFYCQGCITPHVAYENNLGNGGGRLDADLIFMDTSSQAFLAIWGPNSNMYLQYHIGITNSPQSDGGGSPAGVTGSGSFSAEWVGERIGDTTVNNSATSAGVGFKFDGLHLIATNDIIPISSNNLGSASNPWNNFYFTGSIIGPNSPWIWSGVNGSCGSPQTGKTILCLGDLGTEEALISYNGNPLLPVPQVIANGTAALGTSAISSNGCATAVTISASGVATTDNIEADFNADPTGTVGYQPGAMLTIAKYPTANNVNFKVCNNTASSITPGAITLNWRVMR